MRDDDPGRHAVSRGGEAPSARDPVLGKVVNGKYAIEAVVGVGGFGTVYRAIQQPVGRPVALKVVHPRYAHDPLLRARFFREAKLVARLSDRVVVTLYDYGESPELGLYMAFELIEGVTLSELLAQGHQPAERVANILLQLLRALGEAHGLGILHRDLKPGNIMLVRDSGAPMGEGVKLLDFGIAKMKVEMTGQDPSIATQHGLFIGTPGYISPEQARSSGEVDGRSDLYSLAVVGYTLLAGKNPFAGASVVDTILAHCNTIPPHFPESLQVPAQLEIVLRKALEKCPEDRFASAMQMSAAIEAAVPSLMSGSMIRGLSGVALPREPSSVSAMAPMPESTLGAGWSQSIAPPERPRRSRWALVFVPLLVIALGSAAVWTMGQPRPPVQVPLTVLPQAELPEPEGSAVHPAPKEVTDPPSIVPTAQQEPKSVSAPKREPDPVEPRAVDKPRAPRPAPSARRRRPPPPKPARPGPKPEPSLVIPEF